MSEIRGHRGRGFARRGSRGEKGERPVGRPPKKLTDSEKNLLRVFVHLTEEKLRHHHRGFDELWFDRRHDLVGYLAHEPGWNYSRAYRVVERALKPLLQKHMIQRREKEDVYQLLEVPVEVTIPFKKWLTLSTPEIARMKAVPPLFDTQSPLLDGLRLLGDLLTIDREDQIAAIRRTPEAQRNEAEKYLLEHAPGEPR